MSRVEPPLDQSKDLNLLDDSMRKFQPEYIEQASMEFESHPKVKIAQNNRPQAPWASLTSLHS